MGEQAPLLGPVLADPDSLAREARRRRKDYDTKSVHPRNVQTDLDEGWLHDRKLKRRVRLKKLRMPDERLENRFWRLLYALGYPEMNGGRSFRITVRRHGAEDFRKQIDVFAKDDETVIVAECKAAELLKKRTLQKDLEEFANLKGPIAKAIKNHYGKEFKPKILWMFVTENIIWSKPDKERAKGLLIKRVTEEELRYFHQIANHLGPAARYQFLAEFLAGTTIPELKDRRVPAIRGRLGGRAFYCFMSTPRELLKISFVNHRALNDPEGAPTYQRLVDRSRIKNIGEFLMRGGYFPTNILINFQKKPRFDPVKRDEDADVTYGYLYLPDTYKSAWIIDGQHRLYGYSRLDDRLLRQNMVVLAFDRMKTEDEADLFVTINHEQRTVPRNLLDELEGELKWGSKVPSQRIGSIAARLIQDLKADVGEPFYNRVTAQGIRATQEICLTVPAIKDSLKRSGLLGRAVLKRKVYEPGPLSGSNDYETLARARSALNLHFSQIREANRVRWDNGRDGLICTNVGVQGHLMLLAAIIKQIEADAKIDARQLAPDQLILLAQDHMRPVLEAISAADNSQIEVLFKVPYGSGGPVEYFYRLCRLVRQRFTSFAPDGYKDWETAQSKEKIETADRKLKELNVRVQAYIFKVFRRLYGEAKNAYWEKGVASTEIKTGAYEKSQEHEIEERLALEHYLDFIDYKKIVQHKQNWSDFRDVFDIPEPGVKGLAKNLRWMDHVNELRRIPAHPTEQRTYRVEDFDYIDWIHGEFLCRLEAAESVVAT